MDYTTAFAEDKVPSTGEDDPYMHVFLDAGGGNVLAFFELPTQPEMDRDRNTPGWVQHIAFEVADLDALLAAKAHVEAQGIGRDANTPAWVQHLALRVADEESLMRNKRRIESHGVEVLGPVDHGICKSIYFFDPNGHRLELACNIGTPEQLAELRAVAPAMLEEWSRTKRAPRHAAWLHAETTTP
jgi:glyoxylase I family protein